MASAEPGFLAHAYVVTSIAIGLLIVADSIGLARRGGMSNPLSIGVAIIELLWFVASAAFLGASFPGGWLAAYYLMTFLPMAGIGVTIGMPRPAPGSASPSVIHIPLWCVRSWGVIGLGLAVAATLQLLMPAAMAATVAELVGPLESALPSILIQGFVVASIPVGLLVAFDYFVLARRRGLRDKPSDVVAGLIVLWAVASISVLFLGPSASVQGLAVSCLVACIAIPVAGRLTEVVKAVSEGGSEPAAIQLSLLEVWTWVTLGLGLAIAATALLLFPATLDDFFAKATGLLQSVRYSLWPIDRTLAVPLSAALAVGILVKAGLVLVHLIEAVRKDLPLTPERGALQYMQRPTEVFVQIVLMFESIWFWYAIAHLMFVYKLYAERYVNMGTFYLAFGHFLLGFLAPRFIPNNRVVPFLAPLVDIVAAIVFLTILMRMI